MIWRPVWRPCHAASEMAQLSLSVPQEVKNSRSGLQPSACATTARALSTMALASRPSGYWAEGLPYWPVSTSIMACATGWGTGVVAAWSK